MNARSFPLFVACLALVCAASARAALPTPDPDDPACTERDRGFMSRTYELARVAMAYGGAPFGAVLVLDGKIIAEYSNNEFATHDVTKHAETGLISAFSPKINRATFARSTLYTSSEPCTMCCGSIRYAGIGKVVFGTGELQFLRVMGRPVLPHPLESKEVMQRTAPGVLVLGPLMEAEGLKIHEDYWPKHLQPLQVPATGS